MGCFLTGMQKNKLLESEFVLRYLGSMEDETAQVQGVGEAEANEEDEDFS